MTDQVDVFQSMLEGKQQQTATPDQGAESQQPSGNNGTDSILSQIKNEKGEPKYKTVEDAIAALQASQEHISTLEKENQEYRSKTQESTTVQQILDKLDSTRSGSDDNQKDFSMEEIKTLVSQTLEERETMKAAQDNKTAVVTTLQEKYGEKAQDEFRAKAQDLGLTVEEFVQLSARSPKAVLQYFDISSGQKTNKNIQGSTNTEQFQQYNQSPQKAQPIMYNASTQNMVNAWRAAAESVEKQY